MSSKLRAFFAGGEIFMVIYRPIIFSVRFKFIFVWLFFLCDYREKDYGFNIDFVMNTGLWLQWEYID